MRAFICVLPRLERKRMRAFKLVLETLILPLQSSPGLGLCKSFEINFVLSLDRLVLSFRSNISCEDVITNNVESRNEILLSSIILGTGERESLFCCFVCSTLLLFKCLILLQFFLCSRNAKLKGTSYDCI